MLGEATMLRRLLVAAACLLLSVQLGTADEKTKGKISIWLGYPETLDAFKLGQAEFKEKWPNVDVEILTFELREFEAKLAVSVPAGSGPDILALHDFIFPRYYEGGNLADVPADLAKNIDAAAHVLVDHVEHLHGPKKSDDWALKHDAQGFASGAASMFARESWVIPFVKKNGPDIKFGIVPVPRDKAWGAYNNLEILSVNKDSKLKDAAWDFIRLLQDPAIVNNVLDGSGWVPIRHDRDYST